MNRRLFSALCLSLLLVPAMVSATTAASPAAPAATDAKAEAAPAAPAAPLVAEPLPVFLTGCSASVVCLCGGSTFTISCTGTTTCREGGRSVTCDGVRTQCPPIGSCPH